MIKTGILFFLLLPSYLPAAKKHLLTTKERAAKMFRSPSGKEEKIDRKFQPIDHVIKSERNDEQERIQKSEKKKVLWTQ